MGDDDRYLGIAELVTYSSLSERTIRRALADADNPIPSHRVGGRVLVLKSAFDAWIRQHAPARARRGGDDGDAKRADMDRRVAAAVRSIRGR